MAIVVILKLSLPLSKNIYQPPIFVRPLTLHLSSLSFFLFTGGASTYLGASSDKTAHDQSAAFDKMIAAGRKLAVTTWNIAAINNNPFEYWITYKENPAYEALMINIEKFLEEPGDKDVEVKQVFTEEMFTKLDSRLTGVGWTSVRNYWESEFQNRKIVSGFMKVCVCVCLFGYCGRYGKVEK